MDRLERPKSLTELVSTALRQEIIDGDLQMGEALSEVQTAKRLGVSRTPVREAFARLELEGLLYSLPQRGTFVFDLDISALQDICVVRVCLETTALREAATRDRNGLIASLREICDKMTEARNIGDDATYLRLDTEFHQALFNAANNSFLSEAYQTIAFKMAALRNRLGNHPDHMTKSFREHLEIADAVAAADVEKAQNTLVSHIGRKEGSYWNFSDQQNNELPRLSPKSLGLRN